MTGLREYRLSLYVLYPSHIELTTNAAQRFLHEKFNKSNRVDENDPEMSLRDADMGAQN